MKHRVEPPVSPLRPEHIAPDARVYADRFEMMRAQRAEVVAEVGTYEGYFAAFILDALAPKALHLFDIDIAPLRAARPEVIGDGRVTLWEGDSATNMASLPEDSFDLIYIDGDHTYDGVGRDTAAATRLIRLGGLIVFNDYTLWSILQMSRYGVVQHVNDLCVTGRFLVEGFAFQAEGYHDIALRCVS